MRSLCNRILFTLTLLLSLNGPVWAQTSSSVQSGTVAARQGTVTPRVDTVATSQYLSETPFVVSSEERSRLEKALEHTHLPGPAIPVSPGAERVPIPQGLATETEPPLALQDPQPLLPDDFLLFRNASPRDSLPPNDFSVPFSWVNEPSVAAIQDIVFETGNWYAALSTNAGRTFTFINPLQGPFPPVNGGFCCDQVTIHEPSRKAIFWLQQYLPDTDVNSSRINTQRINVDRDANGTWDCSYDFTPQSYGLPTNRFLDFPDLVLGTSYLYHTTNVFMTSTSQFSNAVIARYPLDTLATCGTLAFTYQSVTDRGSFRATHGAKGTIYWGTHNATNSLRIYRWAENSNTIAWDNRDISSWNNATRICPGPDGKDWCGRADGRILAAYVAKGILGFMWNAAQTTGRPYPYVRIARFNESDRALIGEDDIFSSTNTWVYPSVSVNARGHLGGTIMFGGGNLYPSCSAWIADDINGGALQPLETVVAATGASGPLYSNVWGDYLTSRPHGSQPNTWVGTCYAYTRRLHSRYVHFGRARDGIPDIVTPIPGTSLLRSSHTFTLTTNGVTVDQLWLSIDSTPGRADIYNQDLGLNLTAFVSNLPTDGRPLFVRLWYRIGTVWRSRDYTYFAALLTPTLAVEPTVEARGNSVTATWTNISNPTSKDWIGLYTPGTADTANWAWRYTTGARNGDVPFTLPATLPPGTYELRLFANNSYTRLAKSNPFTVLGSATPTLTASPTSVARGESITATWTDIANPNATDWIGVYTPGASNTANWVWRYTTGTRDGNVPIYIPMTLPPGTYELRLFFGFDYTLRAKSNTFSVTGP